MFKRDNYIIVMLFCLVFLSCNKKQETKTNSEIKTEIKTIQTESGWGYDISVNGKPYLHQLTIPALSGNNGFKTKEDAEKIAGFVCEKIKNNIMPPSVTPEELDSLGIK